MCLRCRRMTRTSVRDFCCKVFRYKKRILAVLLLISEAISFVLDQYGGGHLGFLVASFFLSLVFLIMAYNFTKGRFESQNERDVIEFVFSFVQLIVTYVYFVFATLGVKLKLKASIFPLVLAVTSLALAFRSNEQVTDSSDIEIQLMSSNTSAVVVEAEINDSLAPNIQGVSSNTSIVVDEEAITDSRALLLHVTSSNTLAVADSFPPSPMPVDNEESTDLRAPFISSNAPMMSDDEETTSPTMSDDEEVATTPKGWYDVDAGTGWPDVDEGTECSDVDEETSKIDIDKLFDCGMINYSRPHLRSAQSNLLQSTKLFWRIINITDLEKELRVPTTAMKHFPIPEGKDSVDLLVKDLKGKIWNFRLTNHPMPALTDGWLAFVQAKDLEPGSIVIFYKQQDEIFGEQYRVEVDNDYKW